MAGLSDTGRDWSRWLPAVVAVAAALMTWGALQADVRAIGLRVDRLEHRDDTGVEADRQVVQRLAAIEARLDTLRELILRFRRADAQP